MRGTGFIRFEDEIPGNKEELALNEAQRKNGEPISAKEIKTKSEQIRHEINIKLEKIKEERTNEQNFLTEDDEIEAKNKEHVDQMKQGIDNYLESIKKGIISKQNHIGSGLIYVSCVRFHPNGKFFAFSSYDRRGLRYYSLETHKMLWFSEVFKDYVNCLQFSGKGDLILTGCDDKLIRAFDSKTGALMKSIDLGAAVRCVSINKDETLVAAGTSAGTVILISWPNGVIENKIKCNCSEVLNVVFDYKGAYLAGAWFRRWCLINVKTKEVEMMSDDWYHYDNIYSIAFSPDDRYLATGSGDRQVKIYDLEKRSLSEFNPEIYHESFVQNVRFGRTSKTLLSCSRDGEIKIWDTTGKGKVVGAIKLENCIDFTSEDISPDESKIIASSKTQIYLYDARTKTEIKRYISGFEQKINKSLFNSDASLVVSLSKDENSIRIHDVKTGEQVGEPVKLSNLDEANKPIKDENGSEVTLKYIDFSVQILGFQKNRSRFCASYYRSDNKFGIICFESDRKVWETIVPDQLVNVRFSFDGSLIFAGTENSKIYVFENLSGGTKTVYADLPTVNINDLVISANGSFLVFGGSDIDKLFIYETKVEQSMKKNVKDWRVSHTSSLKQLAMSPDENYLASLDDKQVLVLSDLRKREQIFVFGGGNGFSVAFSVDSKRIFTAGYDLNVYDVTSKVKLMSYTVVFSDPLYHIQLSQDGALILTAGQFNVIEIFKVGSDEEDKKYFGNTTSVIQKIVYNKAEDKYALINNIKQFKIFDARTDKEIPNSGKSFENQPLNFVFDENEQKVLFVGGDFTLCKLSNFSELEEIKTASSISCVVMAALFLKRSDRIAIGASNGHLTLLNYELEAIVRDSYNNKHSDWIREILSHPSKPEIFTASWDGSVKVWNEEDLDLLRTIIPGDTSFITSLALSLDGNTLYISGDSSTFYMMDANVQSKGNPKFMLECEAFHSSQVYCMQLNSKGDQLLSISNEAVKVWKVNQNGLELLRNFNLISGCQCNFSKDGLKILIATKGNIHTLNLSTGECEKKVVEGPTKQIESLFLSSDDSKLLVAEYEVLTLVQTKDFKVLEKIKLETYFSSHDVFREENKFALYFYYSGAINVYDFDTLKLLRTLNIPFEDKILRTNIKFLSPDKLMLLDSSLRIFDVSSDSPTLLKQMNLEKPVDKIDFYFKGGQSKVAFTCEHIINCYSLQGLSGEIELVEAFKPVVGDSPSILYTNLDISPDGERIYLLSHVNKSQHKIIVLDALSGYIIKTYLFQNESSVLKGNFSPDCNTFAFWTGRELLVMDTDVFIIHIASNEYLERVESIIFTNNSNIILTASHDSRISVFDVEFSSLMSDTYILSEVCKRAEKDPTELAKLDINKILNRSINIFSLFGRRYPLNVLHYLCLYNFEKVLSFVLNNVNKDNSDLLYSLLNQRNFIDQTPYEMVVTTGNVYMMETFIRIQLKTNKQSRFISDGPFQTRTLDLILKYYPNYLSQVLNSQLCTSNQIKVVKLPFECENQTFLPNYQSKFQHKDVIEKGIYKGGGKKTDFSCKVLVVEDILNPKNKFLKQLSERLGETHDVFESDALNAVLEFKWHQFGRKRFIGSACKYFLYFILVVIASLILFPMHGLSFLTVAPNEGLPASFLENILKGNLNLELSRPSHPITKYNQNAVFIASIVFDILILLYLLIAIIPYEVKQIGIKRLGYFTERIWNLLDFLLIVVGTGSMIFHILVLMETVKPELNVIRGLKVMFFLNLLITWLRMAEFLRGFRLTAGLLRFLTRVFSQMKPFFIVLFYLLLGIGLSTFLLQNNYETFGRWDFIMMFYNIILGHKDEFEMMSHTTSVFEDLFFIVFFLTTIFFVMIMLNLLIAIVIDTHSMVVAVEERAFQYERLNLITEYEETMSQKETQNLMNYCQGTFLYVIRSTKEARDYDEKKDCTDPEKKSRREKIYEIYTEVNSNAQSVKGLVEDNKTNMEIINEKFLQINANFESLKDHVSEELSKFNHFKR